MGILVRMLGAGIGLATEAINHNRARSRSNHPAPAGQASSSTAHDAEAPPHYVEVDDEATAEKLVRSGQAERVHSDDKKAHHDDSESDSDSDTDEELGRDEAAWQLDEMGEDVAPPNYQESEAEARDLAAQSDEQKAKKEDEMIQKLVKLTGPVPVPAPRLDCPVIIPQRRPRQKDRGFVRAYAPVLTQSGIAQDAFLAFLKDWHAASKASPWIEVVFIAASVAGFVPEVAAQVVSTVVQVAAGTAREIQSRSRRNSFLDRYNEQVLVPRGLFGMVMAFKDDLDMAQTGPLSRLATRVGHTFFTSERLDLDQTAAKFSAPPDPAMTKLRKGLRDIRLTNGKTHGQIELPEAAALVYPALDHAAEQDLEATGKGKAVEQATIKDKWKGAGKFVSDYLDRRGQALYVSHLLSR